MIIICCFTDCAAAITLAYEKPEADLLLRPPRNIKKDHLVDTKLVFHAYFVVGLLECLCSFSMAFWYMERKVSHHLRPKCRLKYVLIVPPH
jgi:sodium/potassium-transporting ATPase subunit alpha